MDIVQLVFDGMSIEDEGLFSSATTCLQAGECRVEPSRTKLVVCEPTGELCVATSATLLQAGSHAMPWVGELNTIGHPQNHSPIQSHPDLPASSLVSLLLFANACLSWLAILPVWYLPI